MLLAIVASSIGTVRFHRLSPSLRALTLLVGFDAILESTGLMLLHLHKPNLFLLPIVIVGEAGLQMLMYGRAFRSKAFWRVAFWLIGGLVLYALLDSLLIPGTIRFRPSLQILGNLISLFFAGLYFRKILNELLVDHLGRDPLFWVSIGLALCSLGDLLISLSSDYLLHHYSQQLNIAIWRVHSLLVVSLYICYCVALLLHPRQLAPSTRSS